MNNTVDAIRNIKKLSIEEVKKTEEYIFIDVRENHEFLDGTIPGALTIGRGFLEIELEKRDISRDAKIILFCASGTRSKYAALNLILLEYTNVYSLDGGFEAWKASGKKIQKFLTLNDQEKKRYARHLSLKEIGIEGQLKIMKAKVVVIGAGGLGSSCLLYLGAAGIGNITIVDDDTVELGNLQRQVIHREATLTKKKVTSAMESLQALNSNIKINLFEEKITIDNVEEIISGHDVIVDCTDNFKARYIINDVSVSLNKPMVSAAVLGFSGQIMTRSTNSSPCYRCVYAETPPLELSPSCSENGVLGVVPGLMGMYQANEVIKLILNIGQTLDNKILKIDLLENTHRVLGIKKRDDCHCGKKSRE